MTVDKRMTEARFIECRSREIVRGAPALVGLPLDVTCTFRSGAGNGPHAIRTASDSIESYSPFLDRDLVDSPFSDIGDIDLSGLSLDSCLERIESAIRHVLEHDSCPLCIGGEHTVTLPIIKALEALRPGVVVVHADAHSDLRDQYEGSRINHATVIRRVAELVGKQRLIQVGIRSGTKEEFGWMRENGTLIDWNPSTEKTLLQRIGGRPVYFSLDLDVLDPACFPGTGNPEAGGWLYRDLERLLFALDRIDLVGADVVELNPILDKSDASTITAAKIVRELLLILGNKSQSATG